MISPKASPPTLRRERGEEPRRVLFVQANLVAHPPWELKRQCVLCGCMDITDPRSTHCQDCVSFNPHTLS